MFAVLFHLLYIIMPPFFFAFLFLLSIILWKKKKFFLTTEKKDTFFFFNAYLLEYLVYLIDIFTRLQYCKRWPKRNVKWRRKKKNEEEEEEEFMFFFRLEKIFDASIFLSRLSNNIRYTFIIRYCFVLFLFFFFLYVIVAFHLFLKFCSSEL